MRTRTSKIAVLSSHQEKPHNTTPTRRQRQHHEAKQLASTIYGTLLSSQPPDAQRVPALPGVPRGDVTHVSGAVRPRSNRRLALPPPDTPHARAPGEGPGLKVFGWCPVGPSSARSPFLPVRGTRKNTTQTPLTCQLGRGERAPDRPARPPQPTAALRREAACPPTTRRRAMRNMAEPTTFTWTGIPRWAAPQT